MYLCLNSAGKIKTTFVILMIQPFQNVVSKSVPKWERTPSRIPSYLDAKKTIQTGIWCSNDIVLTSMWRDYVIPVGSWCQNDIVSSSQWAVGAKMTLYHRQWCDVITSHHWRRYNVMTLYRHPSGQLVLKWHCIVINDVTWLRHTTDDDTMSFWHQHHWRRYNVILAPTAHWDENNSYMYFSWKHIATNSAISDITVIVSFF